METIFKVCRVCLKYSGIVPLISLNEGSRDKYEMFQSLSGINITNEEVFICGKCYKDIATATVLRNMIRDIESSYFSKLRVSRLVYFRSFDVCRGCLSPSTFIRLLPIYEDEGSRGHMFNTIADLDVSKDAHALLCEQCLADLTSAFEIRERIRHFDQAYFNLWRLQKTIEKKIKSNEESQNIKEPLANSKAITTLMPATNHFCADCDKPFASKETLRIHIETVHLKIKRFACDSCDYKTYYCRNMRTHKRRIHIDPSMPLEERCPFMCSYKECSKRFVVKQDMKQHEKSCWAKLKRREIISNGLKNLL